MHVAMLAFPNMTQLDLTAPFEVFARFPEISIQIVWKDLEPVKDLFGLQLLPTSTFQTCEQADMIFVPGGPGQVGLMNDDCVLGWLRDQAKGATWITSVCTGSLVLAAAGLLKDYRATCHWTSLEQLALFDAIPVSERVVIDRNRVTGAGVTSGIDFALTLMTQLYGAERAKMVQLAMEYDPMPPFRGGSVHSAEPALIAASKAGMEKFQEKREEASRLAADRLRNAP